MDYDKFEIKNKINDLYNQLQQSAATFIYNPNEIEKIRQDIFKLQEKCFHKYENDKCIYCRKEQGNVDEEKRYL